MNGFPNKILLATDGSAIADQAARVAVELHVKTGSELYVVHVAPVIPAYDGEPESPSSSLSSPKDSTSNEPAVPTYDGETIEINESGPSQLERGEQELLTKEVEELRGLGGVVAEAYLREGQPADEIISLSRDLGIDLIVLGSRGLNAPERFVLGSVSESVLHKAHCPVLIVPSKRRSKDHSRSK